MKLINVLQEIQIKTNVQIIKMNPNPSKLIDPDNNDTMDTWFKKNKINFSFDKYKLIQHRINSSVKIDMKYDINENAVRTQFQKDLPKDLNKQDIYWVLKNKLKDNFESEWNKYAIKPVVNSWQAYFNRVCGAGRVKVWMDPNNTLTYEGVPNETKLRFIIGKASPADFKMIP